MVKCVRSFFLHFSNIFDQYTQHEEFTFRYVTQLQRLIMKREHGQIVKQANELTPELVNHCCDRIEPVMAKISTILLASENGVTGDIVELLACNGADVNQGEVRRHRRKAAAVGLCSK